ncbi:methyltransferase [Myroides sp. JBRI-B21084]|uniref:methyltransferase n=1 Tax=Myroides sp. JBRI-B21084 TaxID=3119977 RepID=UPI0026E353FD|nr:methyltransferase [Paenimyroides cloacae]WKW46368.1 methyltransferase [Paenimyroides cloacae]
MYEKTYPKKRFKITIDFLKEHLSTNDTILDLGEQNPLSTLMKNEGFNVQNTNGEDLDNDQTALINNNYNVLTAFEIFEHLLNPYTVLKNCKANKIVISVPLRLWFSTAYRSKTDMRDRHYHEFEDWQLDWLIEKCGYKITARKKWAHTVNKIGIRPFLRKFTPRYYMILAEKI